MHHHCPESVKNSWTDLYTKCHEIGITLWQNAFASHTHFGAHLSFKFIFRIPIRIMVNVVSFPKLIFPWHFPLQRLEYQLDVYCDVRWIAWVCYYTVIAHLMTIQGITHSISMEITNGFGNLIQLSSLIFVLWVIRNSTIYQYYITIILTCWY